MIEKGTIRVLTTHVADFDFDLNSLVYVKCQRPVVALLLPLRRRRKAGAYWSVHPGYGRQSAESIVPAVKLSGSRLSMPRAT